jgi:hypothetical protein
MIALIALMIGAYIITKMLHMILDEEKVSVVTWIFAGGTIVITLYVLYSLFIKGIDLTKSVNF